ncbi:MAG: peptide ABC transporter substrate-binding protein [Candidatus Reconcilbacillus cellulovorans]|uniref:Peptide ABC transporter substrate-binding protein n=1 Tax=Candidatus Reconcilbacillus cellulovorans TaxID=1906605 RepID=A0A2A6E0U2_9BACL|nr:MAG: peptide ABC transporter substrate-binding protein [Candidatus Reconcilbacillus cellulovorans]
MSRLQGAKRLVFKGFLTASLGVGLTACPAVGERAPKPTDPPGSAPKLSWMAIQYTRVQPRDTVLRRIEKETGVDLEIWWVPDEHKDGKIDTALVTDFPTDVVTIVDLFNPVFRKAVREGKFWEIGPYLREYPNLQKMNPLILKNIEIEGKIYGIYRERDLSRQGIIYRRDWLERLGLTEPRSVDDLYRIMKAFTEQDPDRDGVRDTYGLADRADLRFGAFKTLASYFGAPNEWGVRDGRLLPEFMFEPYREAMRFMRRLYREGLVNPDFALSSKSKQWDLFAQGKAGVYIGNLDDAVNLYHAALPYDPSVRIDMTNRIAGRDGCCRVWSQAGHNGMFVFPKSRIRTQERLRQVLAFFDRLADPDIGNYLHYGIEGIHYRVVDGRVQEIEGTEERREAEVRPLLSLIGLDNRSLEPGGNPLKMKSEALTADNLRFLVPNPAESLVSETWLERRDELDGIIRDATFRFILGQLDENGFDAAVSAWRNAGGDRVIEEINAAYRNALWRASSP